MAKVKVVTVCGSGTVSSTMLAAGVTEFLEDKGYEVDAVETMPSALENLLENGGWDFIVTSTALDEDFRSRIPVINGLPFLTGVGVDKFEEEILQVLANIKK